MWQGKVAQLEKGELNEEVKQRQNEQSNQIEQA
jgi:hypothetical protein